SSAEARASGREPGGVVVSGAARSAPMRTASAARNCPTPSPSVWPALVPLVPLVPLLPAQASWPLMEASIRGTTANVGDPPGPGTTAPASTVATGRRVPSAHTRNTSAIPDSMRTGGSPAPTVAASRADIATVTRVVHQAEVLAPGRHQVAVHSTL